jgi:hypothetical protein
MFIFNSPRLTITRSNKHQTIDVTYEFHNQKDEFSIDKLEQIRSIIDSYTCEFEKERKMIVRSNIPNIKIICSRCKFDVDRLIFIGNDNKVYM